MVSLWGCSTESSRSGACNSTPSQFAQSTAPSCSATSLRWQMRTMLHRTVNARTPLHPLRAYPTHGCEMMSLQISAAAAVAVAAAAVGALLRGSEQALFLNARATRHRTGGGQWRPSTKGSSSCTNQYRVDWKRKLTIWRGWRAMLDLSGWILLGGSVGWLGSLTWAGAMGR